MRTASAPGNDAAAALDGTVAEALGKLGGNGTTLLLGDWSRAPQFLFPPGIWGGGPYAGK